MNNTEDSGEQLWAVEVRKIDTDEFVGFFVTECEKAEGYPQSAVSRFYEVSDGGFVAADVRPFGEVFFDETAWKMGRALADALREEQRHNQGLESQLLSLQDTLVGAISDAAIALQR